MSKKEPGYGKAIEELESIIEAIESESIEVDLLTEKVKRASYLIGLCKGKLRDTEGEVKKVLEGLDAVEDELEGEAEAGAEQEGDAEEGGDSLF